ncbi:MAG TPA: Rad52/Rad22 family DNA repair protein [Candidatus Angelobacter sp.]
MTTTKKNSESVRSDGTYETLSGRQRSAALSIDLAEVRKLVAKLEVPFQPAQVEWRVMATGQQGRRGLIMPYADQRAYIDRLNEIFTPAGWTRKYTVTTSASFERDDDKKLVAKVFVTCELTIHGIGSHSATGEEWIDDDNAGTSAEAQAFKRACACFGLGRYLYYFTETWVDLNERQQLLEEPQLAGWATPEGWNQGMRPQAVSKDREAKATSRRKSARPSRQERNVQGNAFKLIQQIEAMAEPLGKKLYRGLLKTIAHVWKPSDITDTALLERVWAEMQIAEQEVTRLETVRQTISAEDLRPILQSLNLKSPDQVDNLDDMRKLSLALEQKAGSLGAA